MRLCDYDLVADYHTHTVHSHGKHRVVENIRVAAERGLTTLAISDHGPANLFGVGVAGFHTFDTIRKEVEEAESQYPGVRVLLGVEANVISEEGDLDIPLDLQDRFDIVLAGLHPLVRWGNSAKGIDLLGKNVAGSWMPAWGQEARKRNTRAIVNAVLRNKVHIVTHPGYRLSIDTRELARACAKCGCAMEISSSHEHTSIEYIRVARSEGARFALGSDAHTADRVGDLARAASLAQAAGLSSQDIVNAGAREGNRS